MTHEEIDAMQVGPEMDCAVAVAAGFVEGEDYIVGAASGYPLPNGRGRLEARSDTAYWCPSSDLNAAVEALGGRAAVIELNDCVFSPGWHRAYLGYADEPVGMSSAQSPALALCRALLKSASA